MIDNERKPYDITIIGGGPTGLFAAFYAGMRNLSVKIVDSLPQLGGQLSTLYPEKFIYDVPGFPKIKAQDLVDQLIKQAQLFNPKICLGEEVFQLEIQKDGSFYLETSKQIHHTKTLIIAAGNGAFNPRKLKIEKASDYETKNLHYFINDLQKFNQKNIMICGGGDSAVDWALMLEPIAKQVTLVHRRETFRAHEHSMNQLIDSNVKIMTPFIPISIKENNGFIETVELEKVKEKITVEVPVDDLIVNYGFISSLGPIKDFGLEIKNNSIIVNPKMETNIPGVYAAGDICTYEGKVKLIATGFGDAPTAVNNAKVFLEPQSKAQPIHSTSVFS